MHFNTNFCRTDCSTEFSKEDALACLFDPSGLIVTAPGQNMIRVVLCVSIPFLSFTSSDVCGTRRMTRMSIAKNAPARNKSLVSDIRKNSKRRSKCASRENKMQKKKRRDWRDNNKKLYPIIPRNQLRWVVKCRACNSKLKRDPSIMCSVESVGLRRNTLKRNEMYPGRSSMIERQLQ